jgi:O-antigen/teichoic acid export membrane protein
MTARAAEPLFAGLLYLGTARVVVVCMNLISTSRLAHALGAENFGLNSFAISYVSYFMMAANLGYEMFLAREIARDQTKVQRLVDSAINMRLLLAAGSAAILVPSLWLLGLSPLGRTVVLIQGINLFSSAIGLTCVYQGLQRMRVVAFREFMASLMYMIGILCFIHSPVDIVAAACITAGMAVLINSTILIQYSRDFRMPRLSLPDRSDFLLARQSMTYFWPLLMVTITYNIHIVLLGLMRSEAETGLFSAGWKLFNFSIMLPNMTATVFLPRIAGLTTKPADRARLTSTYLQATVVFSVPVTILGAALTPQILTVLFGPAFLPALETVRLLLLNGLVVAVNIVFGTPLLAIGRQKTFLHVVALGALTGVLLNLALIPVWGTAGAAMATITDELVILAMFIRSTPEASVTEMLDFGVRCLIAVFPAAIVAHLVPTLPFVAGSALAGLVAGGGVGVVVYLVGLWVLRIDLMYVGAGLRRL